jgi:hypothetical protein
MKRLLLPFIIIVLILGRCEISSALQGKHLLVVGNVLMPDMAYYVRVFSWDNLINFAIVACLLLMINTDGNCHIEWFKKCGVVFCFGVVAIMLIYLMPPDISHYLSLIKNPWFSMGGFIGTCLCLYYLICYRSNMFKGDKVA